MTAGDSRTEPDQVDWESHFNPRVAVPNFKQIMNERKRASALSRNHRPFIGALRYGEAPRSTLDVFPATSSKATLIYLHGGYWRGGAAADNSVIAEHFCDAGIAVFLLNYTLCPDSTVPQIVHQLTQALDWIKAEGRNYGANPDALYLCGTSAGAHLAAMLLASEPDIAGACLISGIYDLAPVLKVSVNAAIRLTEETARQMSPMIHLPLGRPRLVMAVGSQEPALWIQQTLDYHARCVAHGLTCDLLEIPGANHFSVVEALYRETAPIADTMKRVMGLTSNPTVNQATK